MSEASLTPSKAWARRFGVLRPEDILCAEKLVFPGVGAFGSMMEILAEKGYARPFAGVP